MRAHKNSKVSSGAEIHRYFPEWADRPVMDGVLYESDRNSYSAGGYAEEFGYATQPGLPRPARQLVGDAERCRQWRIQIGALHPGYPECSKPLDRDLSRPRGVASADAQSVAPERMSVSRRETNETIEPSLGFRVIRVGQRHSIRAHVGFMKELMLLWKVLGIRRLPKPRHL